MLEIVLPPNRSPLLQPFDRSSAVAVGPAIEGLSIPERPTRYLFDVSSLPNGDYSADVSNPAAAFVFRVAGNVVTHAGSFEELDRNAKLDRTMETGKPYVWTNQAGDVQTVTIG